jgi:hypothetical protein
MPGMNPPPPYVAPPFAFAWLPITPSIVVSRAVQETAGFHDGSEPGAITVLLTRIGDTPSTTEKTIKAESSIAFAKPLSLLERVRMICSIFTIALGYENKSETGVFFRRVYKKIENTTSNHKRAKALVTIPVSILPESMIGWTILEENRDPHFPDRHRRG